MKKNKIAIIGSGMAGATLAYYLQEHATVKVFEKSRGLGGRLATRYTDNFMFDHGAPFFKANHPAFKSLLKKLLASGAVKIWQGRFAEINNTVIKRAYSWEASPAHYIGSPKMTSICKFLLKNVECHMETQVTEIKKQHDAWEIFAADRNLGTFDWVIFAIPPSQAVPIIKHKTLMSTALEKVNMKGCFSLMIGTYDTIQSEFDMAIVKNSDLSWVSFNNTKHHTKDKQSIVALSTNNWADKNMDRDIEEVKEYLVDKLSAILKYNLKTANYVAIHRWRYANIKKHTSSDAYIDTDNKIAACGDWCIKGVVEAAFLSAMQVLKALLSAKINL